MVKGNYALQSYTEYQYADIRKMNNDLGTFVVFIVIIITIIIKAVDIFSKFKTPCTAIYNSVL